ncbi:MAG: DegT/DnrJ/EryC1/StrS family aminotransferase [Candidatus Cloacimonetes bacterium]|nr:DegT/DnrJ/EryC1/StrS family aminotransferase [Candidatus Cloacimonadota bacterium]
MNNYILDNQIIIDFLTPRFDEFKNSENLFICLKRKHWNNVFVASSQIDNLLYVLFREKKRNRFDINLNYCFSLLREFINLIDIVKTPSYIDFENNLCSNDIEDYLIELSAKTISNTKIITRDKKFLKNSNLTISIEQFFEIEKEAITKVDFVDLKVQYISIHQEIDKNIDEVIKNTAFIGGKALKDFNQNFADFIGTKYAIGVGNGTDALEIALKVLEVEAGDEVIVPANSFIATSEAVKNNGGKVVFVDCLDEYYSIDVSKIEAKITSKTKVIIPVHFYGQPADMNPIIKIAKKYNLKILEDAAQAHGAVYKGRNIGTMGDIAAFSFFPSKNLGAFGDAGAIVTNDDILAKKCKMLAKHGGINKYNHKFEGRNSRLDGIQAAILNAKLIHLPKWNEARRRIAELYEKGLSQLNEIVLPKQIDETISVFHLFVIQIYERNQLATYLKENGISTGIHYPIGLPYQEAYKYLNHTKEDFPITYKNQDKILSLPIYPEMTDEMVCYVVEKIKEFYGRK